jgi:hypothetical protein
MDDVSDHKNSDSATELREQPESRADAGTPVGSCNHPARIAVTREEIAILRAFLSVEIDAIIYADELLLRD